MSPLQVDQQTGQRGPADILLALAQYRRRKGRMHFGILLDSAAITGGTDAAALAAVAAAGPSTTANPAGARYGTDTALLVAAVVAGGGVTAGHAACRSAGDSTAQTEAEWIQSCFPCVLRVGDAVVPEMQAGEDSKAVGPEREMKVVA